MREIVRLACDECKRINYTTKRNKKEKKEKLHFKKFCPFCKKHTMHKEVK